MSMETASGSGASGWQCQQEDCVSGAIVRYNGALYCAAHGLAELMRVGVLTIQQRVVDPVADIVDALPRVDRVDTPK